MQWIWILIAMEALSACRPRLKTPSNSLRDNFQESAESHRPNPAHLQQEPFTLDAIAINGKPQLYDFNSQVIHQRYPLENAWEKSSQHVKRVYGQMPPERFGIFELELSPGRSHFIRDMHYYLDETSSRTGMRLIPVSDDLHPVTITNPTSQMSQQIRGSQILDTYVRQRTGLHADDPVFALVAFMHPEIWKATVNDLADPSLSNLLKLEGGQTHVGLYLGEGRTRNSPFDYHDNKWGIKGYPANLYTISLKNVKQSIFNKNAYIVTRILNESGNRVRAPIDYKYDMFRTHNLKETLDFFRAWLDHEWVRPEERRLYGDVAKPFYQYLINDESYAVNCSEHMTIILNVAVNVPQNEKSYQEIWGDEEGARLWHLAAKRWTEIGVPGEIEDKKIMPEIPYQEFGTPPFSPLWKREGIKAPTSTVSFSKGLVWAPQTTADLLVDFVEQYASWTNVGSPTTSLFLYGFADSVVDRMKIRYSDYLNHISPIIPAMLEAEISSILHEDSPLKPLIKDGETSFENYNQIAKAQNPAAAYRTYLKDIELSYKRNLALTNLQKKLDDQHANSLGIYENDLRNYQWDMEDYQVALAAYEQDLQTYNQGITQGRNPAKPVPPSEPIRPSPPPPDAPNIYRDIIAPELTKLSSALNSLVKSQPQSPRRAWLRFRAKVATNVEAAKDQEILTALPGADKTRLIDRYGRTVKAVKLYSPPAILQRITNGVVSPSPWINVEVLGTAIDAEEVVPIENSQEKTYQINHQ